MTYQQIRQANVLPVAVAASNKYIFIPALFSNMPIEPYRKTGIGIPLKGYPNPLRSSSRERYLRVPVPMRKK